MHCSQWCEMQCSHQHHAFHGSEVPTLESSHVKAQVYTQWNVGGHQRCPTLLVLCAAASCRAQSEGLLLWQKN
jgi:hypothetical protein